MNILIAPDKFKGSLSAIEVGNALSTGMRAVRDNLEIEIHPLGDGGEGSLDILSQHFSLQTISTTVADPLMRPIKANYKMHHTVAYIEMSVASGLMLLKPSERNCWNTSTYGTGELILDAVQKGATEIYLLIGGSATNDAGIGMAQALGYRFLDKNGNELPSLGSALSKIVTIDDSNLKIAPTKIKIQVLCDVNSALYGQQGAAYLYAAQKGADATTIVALDEGLRNIARVWQAWKGVDFQQQIGAGASGGLGAGAVAFLGAEAVWGIERIMQLTGFEQKVVDADLVITGEGKIDIGSAEGKVIKGVSDLARKYDKPLFAVCGICELSISEQQSLGIQKIYSILDISQGLEDSIQAAAQKLNLIGKYILELE